MTEATLTQSELREAIEARKDASASYVEALEMNDRALRHLRKAMMYTMFSICLCITTLVILWFAA